MDGFTIGRKFTVGGSSEELQNRRDETPLEGEKLYVLKEFERQKWNKRIYCRKTCVSTSREGLTSYPGVELKGN